MRKFEKNRDEEVRKKEVLKEKISHDYISYFQMGGFLLIALTIFSASPLL
jgi:hypothetical protein